MPSLQSIYAALPPGVPPFMPVAEFIDARYPSGRHVYCSKFKLYELKKQGKIRFKYSEDTPYVDMVSWFSHLTDANDFLAEKSRKGLAARKAG